MFFHRPGGFDPKAYSRNRGAKRKPMEEGKAHGTVVYCGRHPAGWCRFGPREELPRIDRKRGHAPTPENPGG